MQPLTSPSHSSSFLIVRLARIILLLTFCLPLPLCAQDADNSGSGKLASVKVTGSVRYRADLVAAATGLSLGTTINKGDLQRGADLLAGLGIFATVQYRYASEDAGVRAEYQVTDAPGLPVWFDNFPWFTDDELTAALKRAVPLFDGAAPERGTVLNEMSDALEALLETRGVHSSVSHAVATAPVTDAHVLQFRVENVGVNIASVEFSDPLAMSDRGIHSLLSNVVGQQYSRTLIELFEFEQVRPVYISHAYLRVRFGAPSVRITGSGGDARAVVVAPVEPGPVFAWSGVTWTGNSVVSSAELNNMIVLKAGDPADGMKMEAIWDAVRDAYTRRGYLDINLTTSPQFDDNAKRASYAVTIAEGRQFRMGKLVLTGLSIEGERRIRAAWGIADGAVFDKSVYEQFAATGIKEAFSGLPFHYEKVGRFLQEDAAAGTVDVLLDFQ
jgi:outer membrane protein assembly factor BamA